MQLAKVTNDFDNSSKKGFDNKIDAVFEQEQLVLLIDDEEIVINIAEMMLNKLGYKVLKAHSGQEGLLLFKENKSQIAFIISDLEMPIMNGKKLMDKIRKMDPRIKIVLSSGALTDADEDDVLNQGFSGFIKKPYNIETLSVKIDQILN